MFWSVIPYLIQLKKINNYMKLNQLSQILGRRSGQHENHTVSNAERMNEAVRTVLTKDAELRSKGQRAYNEARQRDFEKKLNEDMKHPQKRTFAEMVNRYL